MPFFANFTFYLTKNRSKKFPPPPKFFSSYGPDHSNPALGPLLPEMVTNIVFQTKFSDLYYNHILLNLCYRIILQYFCYNTFVTDLYYSTYVTVHLLQTFVKYQFYTDICYRLILQYLCYSTFVTDFC